jgi:hypothetical protein
VVLAGLAVVVALGAVVLWPRPESRITVENFRRIREGMTLAEAIAILGPPGDYRTLETASPPILSDADAYAHLGDRTYESVDLQYWENDTADVLVGLDKSGRIVSGSVYPCQTVDHGTLGNLLWRAKRQCHRWFP